MREYFTNLYRKRLERWKSHGPRETFRRFLGAAVFALILALMLAASLVSAAEPADNGVHSSPETKVQGFVVLYAPVFDPALVFYWFTFDQDGNQAWFISDNVPVDAGGSEQVVNIYKPIGSFLSADGVRGDAVGILAIGRQGPRISVRFGISPIDGFDETCGDEIPIRPRPSPLPPPIPADLYPCQSQLVLTRITPTIPELIDAGGG